MYSCGWESNLFHVFNLLRYCAFVCFSLVQSYKNNVCVLVQNISWSSPVEIFWRKGESLSLLEGAFFVFVFLGGGVVFFSRFP